MLEGKPADGAGVLAMSSDQLHYHSCDGHGGLNGDDSELLQHTCLVLITTRAMAMAA